MWREAKWQYLLTLQVSRYCLLALQGSGWVDRVLPVRVLQLLNVVFYLDTLRSPRDAITMCCKPRVAGDVIRRCSALGRMRCPGNAEWYSRGLSRQR